MAEDDMLTNKSPSTLFWNAKLKGTCVIFLSWVAGWWNSSLPGSRQRTGRVRPDIAWGWLWPQHCYNCTTYILNPIDLLPLFQKQWNVQPGDILLLCFIFVEGQMLCTASSFRERGLIFGTAPFRVWSPDWLSRPGNVHSQILVFIVLMFLICSFFYRTYRRLSTWLWRTVTSQWYTLC